MDNVKEKLPQILLKALANTYVIYFKGQSAHWNVEGPDFYQLHQIFQASYEESYDAIDGIAERIRQYDVKIPEAFEQVLKESTLMIPKSGSYVEVLYDLHEQLHKQWDTISSVAEAAEDSATVDMAGKRAGAHAKFAWMFKSIKKGD